MICLIHIGSYFYFDIKFGDGLPIFKREQARPGQARLHTGRNRFNLFQITFSTNTADAHPGVSGVSTVKGPEIL